MSFGNSSESVASKDRKKIFITDIDSPIGYHLVECLRDDHQVLEGHSYIVGWQSGGQACTPHPSIHKILEVEKDKTIIAKCVLESDVIIINLMSKRNWQTQYIIQLLKERSKKKGVENEVKILVIGSYMTWAHMNKKMEIQSGVDKQIQLGKIISLKSSQSDTEKHKQFEQTIFQKTYEDEKKRCPHYLWNWHYDQEQKILQLNKKNSIQTHIITVGLLYGKDFPDIYLSNLLSKACLNQQITCFGDGSNTIPTTYIDDLIQQVTEIMENKGNDKKHHIVVDEATATQIQIIEAFQKMAGTKREVKFVGRKYIKMEQSIISCSVSLKSNRRMKNKSNIISYLGEQAEQIHKYLQFCPLRVLADYKQLTRTNTSNSLQQTNNSVKNGNNFPQNNPNQQKVVQLKQIFGKNGIVVIEESQILNSQTSQNQVTSCQQKLQQIQNFIHKNPLMSFLFILEQLNVTEQFCSQFGIRKFNSLDYENEKRQIIQQYGFVYQKQTQQSPTNQQHNNQQGNDLFLQNDKIVEESKNQQINKQLQIEKIESTNSIALSRPFGEQQKIKNMQISKQKFSALKLDQYLLDNVLSFVSEAFVKLAYAQQNNKRKPQLSDFVEKLKEIYNREVTLKEEITLS